MIFNFEIPFNILNSSLDDIPPGSGVPVPGAYAGSTQSISIDM